MLDHLTDGDLLAFSEILLPVNLCFPLRFHSLRHSLVSCPCRLHVRPVVQPKLNAIHFSAGCSVNCHSLVSIIVFVMNPLCVGSPYAKDYPGIPPLKTTGNSRVFSALIRLSEGADAR